MTLDKSINTKINSILTSLILIAFTAGGVLYLSVSTTYWIGLLLMILILRRKDRSAQVNACHALVVFIAMTFSSLLHLHANLAAQALLGTCLLALVWGIKAFIGLVTLKLVDRLIPPSKVQKGETNEIV